MVRYEGSSPGTDIWGYTQANFLVAIPGRNARESAILMNEPAGKFLAAELGLADSTETRDALARALGEAWFPALFERGADIESIVTVSRGFLDNHPEVIEAVRKALA
ncbi:MAG: hypothetical protein IH609_21755 [Dehalococcoidia bacterium]|nr:hypothetical protein [Dehalococcoidia bacterium]